MPAAPAAGIPLRWGNGMPAAPAAGIPLRWGGGQPFSQLAK
ncbi:hypothetical protein [Mycobacterium tuberculosis]|nr:hypothetical protein [Mycobacterium tuberculosis]